MELLGDIVGDRGLLALIDKEQRRQLLTIAGRVARPGPYAKRELARIRLGFSALLGGMELTVLDPVSLRDFYRVMTPRFADRAVANDLCRRLKARNQDCLVVRR